MESKNFDNIIDREGNDIWNELSALLSNTNEGAHLLLIDPIPLNTDEDVGMSDPEKPAVKEIWQDNIEGIITFKLYGNDSELDLDDYPEFIDEIYYGLQDRLLK